LGNTNAEAGLAADGSKAIETMEAWARHQEAVLAADGSNLIVL